ncbi:ASKHA domain-containing protein [Actomonas aquatica]|uniref:ASKHA domain-containing protein n=1 Tax=Actomonas aquatica TaxID=2866162 RepID=A0ABZ1C6C3_9BACT|nr:ASKHA domain-containing protein [Opitutus sp. WL0086]WRQ85860.1 ASKHA domain-containing protein [Opitutus sp. WL0086]
MPRLLLNAQPVDVAADSTATLFDHAEHLGIRVPTSCRKQGKCRECIMEITTGAEHLSAPGPEEQHLTAGFRLSCRTRLAADAPADAEVHAHTMRRGTLRVENEAYELPVHAAGFTPEPCVTRDGERILLDGVEIDRRPVSDPAHGIALDIGTTTVVLRLLDLESGALVATSSFENPQRFGGSDVMARIAFDTEDKTRSLQRTLLGYLNHAIAELPVPADSIYEVVIAGNSTMRDMFFRLSVYTIGQSPYQSLTEHEMAEGKRDSTVLTTTAKKLGLAVHPAARLYGMPIMSGHVGADTAACMLAADIQHEDRLVAIMDIGTNTELVLGNKDRVVAASCPAGPAFEGGQISCGMPGLPGAIEKVMMDDDEEFTVSVIGGETETPVGLCGSGLVSLLSELVRGDRMNRLGRFEFDEEPIEVAPGVTFSEADVNNLAQAKGANVAGLQIIFEHFGISADQLDVFYLAGGFGRHLDLEASKRIGLIPDIPDAKIRRVGNAAVEGACIALLSKTKRTELEALVRRVEHCRLETHPHFFDVFVEGCQFAPFQSTPTNEFS